MTPTPSEARRRPVLTSKTSPPALPDGAVDRPRIVAALSGPERAAAVVAPPGYGKTVAVRQWTEGETRPVAWLAVDLIDESTTSFWTHLLAALRSVMPALDEESDLLLLERGPTDPVFLAALAAEIERCDPAVLVIDDLARVTDRSVCDGLAFLVDRVGQVVRFVVTGRSDPQLPLARWRSLGWLAEIREDALRLNDAEALAIAARFSGVDLTPESVLALNERAEGWVVGLQMALLSLGHGAGLDDAARRLAGSNQLLTDYIVAEVLDRLSPAHRDVALGLSVVEWFDPELCQGLLGAESVALVHEMHRGHLFLRVIDESTGAMRFHALFRELVENELRWVDPDRRVSLHRRASELWAERGDLRSAYWHLARIGDLASAGQLVIRPAFDFVDRGDRAGLVRLMGLLPSPAQVDDPWMALDFAVVSFFAGHGVEASAWCDRAEVLGAGREMGQQARLEATRAVLALMAGAVDIAETHVDASASLAGEVDDRGPFESWLPLTAARVALVNDDGAAASRALRDARRIVGPVSVTGITLPALEAWWHLRRGDLRAATVLADQACAVADDLGVQLHHGVVEAHVVAGWCRLGAGDLTSAAQLAERAEVEADDLGFAWDLVRSGALAAEVSRVRVGGETALEAIRRLRHRLGERGAGQIGQAIDREIDLVEAAALLDLADAAGLDPARLDDAVAVLARMPDSAHRRILDVRLAISRRDGLEVGVWLADRSAWTSPLRLEAGLLVAGTLAGEKRTGAVAALLREGAETGWVSPFLPYGAVLREVLSRGEIERAHPPLAQILWSGNPPHGPRPLLAEPFTPRELSILELLPTHLSYADIGAQLFISVNTVKTGLKSIYRKLGVGSRSDAVVRAREAGLLTS